MGVDINVNFGGLPSTGGRGSSGKGHSISGGRKPNLIGKIGSGIGNAVGRALGLSIGVAGGIGLVGLVRGISSKLGEVSGTLKGVFKVLETSLLLVLKPIGDIIGTIIKPFALAMLPVAIGFNRLMQSGFFDGITLFLKGLVDIVTGGIQIISGTLYGIFGILDGIKNWIKTGGFMGGKFESPMLGQGKALMKEGAKRMAAGFVETYAGTSSDAFSKSEIRTMLYGSYKDVLDLTGEKLEGGINDVLSNLGKLKSGLDDKKKDIKTDTSIKDGLANQGSMIANNQFVPSALKYSANKMTSAADALYNKMTSWSPPKTQESLEYEPPGEETTYTRYANGVVIETIYNESGEIVGKRSIDMGMGGFG